MNRTPIRILVVDDYETWRGFFLKALQRPQLEIIGQVSDGLEAVQQADKLQPDLILLDIGLPKLNGIEAARRIRKVSPNSKILFVSENRSHDIAEEALSTGAGGYVLKSDAASDLLRAVQAVLKGDRFVSVSLLGRDSSLPMHDQAAAIPYSHEAAFYAGDNSLVDGYALFIESSLKNGNAVIVVVTESHRASLLRRLEADAVGVATSIEQGRYISLDAAETLSRLIVNDMPDAARCANLVGDLILRAAKSVSGANDRVVICAEMAPTLLSTGNREGAISLERLWDEVTRDYGLHSLCGYLSSTFPHRENDPVFQRICAEHSAIHGREIGC